MSELQIKTSLGATSVFGLAVFSFYADGPVFIHAHFPSISEGTVKAITPVVAIAAFLVAVPWRYYAVAWQWLRSDPAKSRRLRCFYLTFGAVLIMGGGLQIAGAASWKGEVGGAALAGVGFFALALLVGRLAKSPEPMAVNPVARTGSAAEPPSNSELAGLRTENARLAQELRDAQGLISKAHEDQSATVLRLTHQGNDALARQAAEFDIEKQRLTEERDRLKQQADERAHKDWIGSIRDATTADFLARFKGAGTEDKKQAAILAAISMLDEWANQKYLRPDELESWLLRLEHQIPALDDAMYGPSGKVFPLGTISGIERRVSALRVPVDFDRTNPARNAALNRINDIKLALQEMLDGMKK